MTDRPRGSYYDGAETRLQVTASPSLPAVAAINLLSRQICEEEAMKNSAALMAFCAAVSVLATQPAAAKSPAMEACSKQWDDMKAAGKTGDKTWPSFWSQCSKDFATNNGADATPASKPAKAEKTLKTVAATHNEDDTANSAQQKKDCDAKWDANKAKTGAHGWHDYFHFMSNCI